MGEAPLDRGVFFRPYQCGACGAQLPSMAMLGNHVRYKPECTFEKRFWGRVEKRADGCWVYHGATDKWGYTHVAIRTKRIQAHRWAYEQAKGPIPAGKLLMHSCDVPACVNPDHLTPGTDADNHADSRAKGRNTFGERNRSAKLTEALVRQIRAEYKGGKRGAPSNVRELMAKYGVSRRQIITNAALGRTWKHVK